MTKVEKIQKMRRVLLDWFRVHRRALPWRETTDAYAIVVSEIMLQQTQVDRVIPKYEAFLRQFPTWSALANTPQSDVVRAWHGLGYNRRAVMLSRLAKVVVKRGGELPEPFADLVALPGIGPYTAEAVRAFAFRSLGAAPVDTNIRRILRRVFGGPSATDSAIIALARELVPDDVWTWNHALMDFGATVCTARAPACGVCPMQTFCIAYPCRGEVSKRKQSVFAGSDRMYRGRIVARLRGMAYAPDDLLRVIMLPDEERFGRLVDDLTRDGLIIEKRGKLFLA